MCRVETLSGHVIADELAKDPRKGKIMVPLAGDSVLCDQLERLISQDLRGDACAIFHEGRVGKVPMDDPHFELARAKAPDSVAVGSRLAPTARTLCKKADGGVHLHRDLESSDLPLGGVIVSAVLLLADVTEETGCTEFFLGTAAVPVRVFRGEDFVKSGGFQRVLGTGKRGDLFLFNPCIVHRVVGATHTGMLRSVVLFDLVTDQFGTSWGKREHLVYPYPNVATTAAYNDPMKRVALPARPDDDLTAAALEPCQPYVCTPDDETMDVVQHDETDMASHEPSGGRNAAEELISSAVAVDVATSARALLLLSGAAASTVIRIQVPSAAAADCLKHLAASWSGGVLPLGRAHSAGSSKGRSQKATGYQLYGKTLGPHNCVGQRANTLYFPESLLPSVRAVLPGFAIMEGFAAQQLQQIYSLLELPTLVLSHVLRQGPAHAGSTAFSDHRDDEDDPNISYSVIVKLSEDDPGCHPSQMRLCRDGTAVFNYGRTAGSSAVFEAAEEHASVVLPPNATEVVKLALFFRHGLSTLRSQR
jgi:hypothetical protein